MGLFNRPASTAATNAASGSNAPTDMFSHSQSYSAILADQEQRRKEKAEKRSKKEGKRKSDEGIDESPKRKKRETPKKRTDNTPRRRISGNDIGNLLRESGLSRFADEESEDEQIVMEEVREKSRSPLKATRSKPTRSSSRTNGKGSAEAEAIEVGGSSGDEVRHDTAPVEEEDDESDEELAALARQARQRRLQRTHAATPDTATKSPTPREPGSDSPQTLPLPDPPVKILVISQIDQTSPLMVYRKLSQNLREIRLAWCGRQGFDQAFTDNVFLVHRMRKVYDVTTCRSLGLETDADGNITMKGAEGKEGVDQVALEAVTQDIYDRMLADKERADAKRREQWDPAANAGAGDETNLAEPVAEEFIGLVLKAKGKPDFKLKVKPVSQAWHPSNRVIVANIRHTDNTLLQDYQRVQEDFPRGGGQYCHARLRRRPTRPGGSSPKHRDLGTRRRRRPHFLVGFVAILMSHPAAETSPLCLLPLLRRRQVDRATQRHRPASALYPSCLVHISFISFSSPLFWFRLTAVRFNDWIIVDFSSSTCNRVSNVTLSSRTTVH
jgi:hypothetical protein